MIEGLKDCVNKIIIFYVCKLRFEGKVLDVDITWLKYYDSHKFKIRYVRLSEIEEWEVKE